MCDTVAVVLGDIVLLAFEKILGLFFWAQNNCIFTTAQISVYNCTNFFTTAQSVHNCTLKKPWPTLQDWTMTDRFSRVGHCRTHTRRLLEMTVGAKFPLPLPFSSPLFAGQDWTLADGCVSQN